MSDTNEGKPISLLTAEHNEAVANMERHLDHLCEALDWVTKTYPGAIETMPSGLYQDMREAMRFAERR